MAAGSSDQRSDGPSWVVGSRQCEQGLQTLYVWAPAQQVDDMTRQLGVQLRLGLMDIADLRRVASAWSSEFGPTERRQATWEEFAGGARVPIAILVEPSPRRPAPLLLRGADSIAALAAVVPAGRAIPVLFASAVQPARVGAKPAPKATLHD